MNARIVQLRLAAMIGLVGLVGVVRSSAAGDNAKRLVDIQLRVLQLDNEDACGALLHIETDLQPLGPEGATVAPKARMLPPIMAMTAGDFRLERDGYVLHFVDGDLKTESPADGGSPPWSLLAAPRIMTLVGQPATMTIGQEVPYMVRREDGSLVVQRSDDTIEGLRFDLRVSAADDEAITFDEIRMKISRVTGRQPIADVPFDVGRPIVSSRETSMSLKLASGQVGVIRVPQGDSSDSPILLLIVAKLGDAQ